MKITLPKRFLVTSHTKRVKPGSIFVAIHGHKEDGSRYIPDALKRGAKGIVISQEMSLSQEYKNLIKQHGATITSVKNTRKELAILSAKQSNYAHKKLKIIGITGTKGKTSTAFILEHILRISGYKTALISSIYNKILDQSFESDLTTDQPDYLHVFFKACLEHSVEFVVMEVAAQAISLHRVETIEFDAVIFTNFSHEHGEFYENMEQYFLEKTKIFTQLKKGGRAFINADDNWCKKIIKKNPDFLSFFLGNEIYNLEHPSLVGTFNKYNIAAAISVAQHIGISPKDAQSHIKTLKKIPGRLELHRLKNKTRVFIDYAHNPSSFVAVLSTLRQMTNHLIVVFGAGGERDHTKRPAMGKIATQIADVVIITSDNPRSEDPLEIIEDICAGIEEKNRHKVMREPDRKKAIKIACQKATPSSIIALLGKGPDEYQIIGNRKIRFSEKEIIQKM